MRIQKMPYYRQPNPYWCGPATAQMFIHAVTGRRIPKRILARMCRTTKADGTPVPRFRRALRDAGVQEKTKVNASLSDVRRIMKSTRKPVVLVYREPQDDDDHYALCVGLTKRRVILNDPWHGRNFPMPRKEFIRRWKIWNCWKWMLWSPRRRKVL